MGLSLRGAPGALLLAVAACAHIEPPPGGPEDKQPPQLLATRPDTMARGGAFREPVVIVFDERVSEQSVRDAVQVSPRTSAVDVAHRGDEIRVSLRRGWEAGRIYQVTVASTVQDLFGNRRTEPVRLVFSTGPEIPDTRLEGTVVSRTTGRPEARARVEAILAPDSLVYAVPADSAGAFSFRQIPAGEYVLRAFTDQNADRALQDYEPRDTARAAVAVGTAPTVRLRLLEPDSTAPRAASAQPVDSAAVEVKFDDFLDPAQSFTPAQVRVVLADSTAVPVTAVELGGGPAGADAPGQPDRRTGAPTADTA
ncbi:MAG TPA: Ig-like domain-containing protein, partial [Longimicrobiaceae bacterium]|nr:Ig-like domain-containing protein [Longimicrobiaceae bacterium]